MCSSPVEKHLYEIIPISTTSSHPCYYCGETDMARTSVGSDAEYPLCDYCRNTKKFGPVLKRKKRTIVPREKKRKNKRKKDENYIEVSDGENGEVENEVAEYEVAENEGVEENNGDDENFTDVENDEEAGEETRSSDEDSDSTWPSLPNSPFRPSLPNSPNRLEAVEDLLGGSDTE